MGGIFSIFTKSPFGSLHRMMDKVIECVDIVEPMVDAFIDGDYALLTKEVERCSSLEYEADKIKDDIRLNMPSSLLMPVAREDVLQILSAQDSIADVAKDIGVLMSVKQFSITNGIKTKLKELEKSVIEVVRKSALVIDKLDDLRESSFGGPVVEEVEKLLYDVNRHEHKTDGLQLQLTKLVVDEEDNFSKAELILAMKIVESMGGLANAAEKMCNRIKLILTR